MNDAMKLLREKAQSLYDMIAGESNIELQIDPIEELVVQAPEVQAAQTQEEKLEANCTVSLGTEEASKIANSLMYGANIPFNPRIDNLNWVFQQRGKVKVWIYNVSRNEYKLGNGTIKTLTVPACPADAEYTVVTSLPAVMITPKDNVDNSEVDYILSDGRRVAMDLINPSNLGLDQDLKLDGVRNFAVGSDFSKKGVFFSTHNPPLKREVKAAHKRLKEYYTDLVDRANLIRIIAAAPALGVTVTELKAAQQYVEDAVFNR